MQKQVKTSRIIQLFSRIFSLLVSEKMLLSYLLLPQLIYRCYINLECAVSSNVAHGDAILTGLPSREEVVVI